MLIRGLLYPNRWDPISEVNREDGFLAADYVTELRTSQNMLSVWLANNEEDIEDAIVALALGKDKPNRMIGYLIDEKDLEAFKIEAKDNQKGDAQGAVESILKKHRNLVELDFWRLGYLTQYMLEIAKDTNRQVILTKDEVEKILNKYKGTKIIPENVNEKLRKKLNW